MGSEESRSIRALGPMVRLAVQHDVPTLVDLIEAFHAEAGHPIDRDTAASAFSSLLQNPGLGAAWILLVDGKPAGYVVLTVCFAMESGGLTGFVDDLFVRREHRQSGLGRAALEAVFDECRRRNVRTLQVVVGEDNEKAVGLYTRCGFRLPADGRRTLVARVAGTPAP